MTAASGTLVLMGSGETTPSMVTVHKAVLDATRERTGHQRVTATLLDTPYGFQENVAEITARTQAYFAHNVGQDVTHLAAAHLDGADGVTVERTLEAMRRSDWLFAGPGSPSYAQRHWADPRVTEAFAEVCARGGTVVLASAAATTAGERTIPVYEIYKAGEAPRWLPGLGLVGRLTGWSCVVVPHYDNVEGGTHDTRFCYLGERRLSLMEADLPAGMWLLGVDEHTACIIDLEAQTVRVEGRGGVHVRRSGEDRLHVEAGTTTAMSDLAAAGAGGPTPTSERGSEAVTTSTVADDPADTSLDALRRRFDQALQDDDGTTATAVALETEALTHEDPAASGPLRAMIIRLGDLAAAGMHDHRELVRPHIETLLHVREDARARKVFEVADHIRGHMDADGVRIEDTREGTRWEWDDPAR